MWQVAGLLLLALLGILGTGVDGQTNVRWGGFVQLDRRVTLADSLMFADFYNVFRPELSASFEGRVDVVASVDLRFYDFSGVQTSAELDDAAQHFPNSITSWETFVRIYGFVVQPLDITVGKQRIQWGTADGFNPTDRFNPYDLTDITNFTARTPIWAVRAEYYPTDTWWVEAVVTPTAHGPLLPSAMPSLLGDGGAAAGGLLVDQWEQHFESASPRLGNAQYGFKVTGRAAGLDLSASYFDGFDGIPAVDRFKLVRTGTDSHSQFAGHAWSALPRIRVLGADAATEWHGIGLWGEGAVVFPVTLDVTTDIITPDDSVREQTIGLTDTPYATWTVGGEYTFPGGWYLNLQWVHGSFLERGAGQLHDYLFGEFEQNLLRETLTLTLGGALEVSQWADWHDHLGLGLFPEIIYGPADNLDVSLGAFIAAGGATALLGRWGDADQLYLRVKASF